MGATRPTNTDKHRTITGKHRTQQSTTKKIQGSSLFQPVVGFQTSQKDDKQRGGFRFRRRKQFRPPPGVRDFAEALRLIADKRSCDVEEVHQADCLVTFESDILIRRNPLIFVGWNGETWKFDMSFLDYNWLQQPVKWDIRIKRGRNWEICLTYNIWTGPRKAVAEVSNHNEPIGRKSGIQLVRKIRKSMDVTFSCFVLNWLTDWLTDWLTN